MSTTIEAANLLSAPPSEQSDLPPVEEVKEGQEAQATQEAQPQTGEGSQETPTGDTEGKPDLHKVKFDGQDLEVEYDELLKGYSREQNYQKKMKLLADERTTFESKQAQLDKQLEDVQSVIDDQMASLNSEEMLALRESDPDKYLKEVDKIQAKAAKLNQVKEDRKAELDIKQNKLIEKERELLFDAFPDWKDNEVMTKEMNVLAGVLNDIGFSPEEFSQMTDHRMFILANKALKFDQIETANLEAKKIETKPVAVTAGTTKSTQETASKAVSDQKAKLKKTGSLKDAAKLLSM